VAVAALWGSSSQLGTGPVAVVSLLTASSLAVLAAPGSDQFHRAGHHAGAAGGHHAAAARRVQLGVIVNFLSHPVIVASPTRRPSSLRCRRCPSCSACRWAAASTSINDIVRCAQTDRRHPSADVGDGALAIAIMWSIKKYSPKLPGVLIAVW